MTIAEAAWWLFGERARQSVAKLAVSGQLFTEAGKPFTVIEASDFALLWRLSEGETIDPILRQRATLGFNMLRVWPLMNGSEIGFRLNPTPYALVPQLLDACANYGLHVELTAYIGPGFQIAHWGMLADRCAGHPNVIMELVNENDVHPMDVGPFSRWPGLLCSHGSNGSQAEPVTPPWDYMTYHTNDAPQWQRKVGHNAMEFADTYRVPVLSNENTRFPDRDQSTAHAYDAARAAALLCAGSGFHSVRGKSSQLWDGIELDCARAWVAGARSVDLTQRSFPYQHRADLETPDTLRVYQRGNQIVNIRR